MISDYDAERSLCGCLQYDEKVGYIIFAYALEKGVSAEVFKYQQFQAFWQALVCAEKEGEFGLFGAIDRLPKSFMENNPSFLDEICNAHDVVSEVRGKKAVDEVLKRYHFRKLSAIGSNLINEVKDAEILTDPIALASDTEKSLQDIIKPTSSSLQTASDLTDSTISSIKRTLKQGPARIEPRIQWLKWGLNGGFKDTHLIVVAARPSVGKTTLVLNFIYDAALQGKKTLFFSLEMKAESLWEKLGLIRSETKHGLPYKTSNETTNKENATILIEHIEHCRQLPIYIDDFAGSNMGNIRTTSRILHRKEGLDCIVIDYLGLVKPDDPKISREQQVADISRSAKQLAKELGIPVFLICQLNRASVQRGSEPQLHDLRESGQIEQDADVVILLHRDLLGRDKEDIRVIVAKNRFGGCGNSYDEKLGESKIKFRTASQRFEEIVDNSPPKPRLHDSQSELYNTEEDRI
tara:strand:- start:8858 stop:10252 length:1395 start_codon:yes stop_codon:yes gene_type:complete